MSLKSENEASLAASLKYFLLSALSTGFLLLGVCILYFQTGTTNYDLIDISIREFFIKHLNNPYGQPQFFFIEIAKILILITLLFKLSAAPFYQWAPDLYENLDTNITMWKIVIPKLTVLSFLFFFCSFTTTFQAFQFILLLSGSLSLIIGSLALYNQWFIKRFFAYSGISHIGFMLLALYSYDSQSFIFYMFIYSITTVNLFTIFILLSEFLGRDLKIIKDLSGLFKFNPILSIAFALNLFSLAGVCLL